MRSVLCIVILALLCCSVQADFTCLTDGEDQTQQCKVIEECFVLYNAASGEREYGCLEIMNAQQKQICSKKPDLCQSCSTPNCNKKDFLKLCISCKTTSTDDRCTIDPENLKQTSAVIPCKGECFISTNNDGGNERGCASKDFDCESYDNDCCEGDLCNDKTWPIDRRVCLTGDDTTEYCLDAKDTCVTILKSTGEPAQIGCTKNVFKRESIKKMCEKNPHRCPQCNENKCNKNQQRQSCMKCEDTKQCMNPDDNPPKEIEYCLGECYVEYDGDNNISRGCADDKECEEGLCLTCPAPFCKELPERQKCFTDKDNEKNCDDAKDKCYSLHDPKTGYAIEQGCFNELSDKNKKICEDKDSSCVVCDDSKCNTGEKIFTCYKCKGYNCLLPENKFSGICLSGKCFVKTIQDGTNERGCQESNTVCDGDCETCDNDDLCNGALHPPNRKSCNNKYCKLPTDKCYVTVFNGELKRGCLNELEGNCDAQSCVQCDEHCDKKIPCLKCQGEACSNPEYCFIEQDSGVCYSSFKNNNFDKGCSSKSHCDEQAYCEECTDSICNEKDPVVDGAKCHRCSGEEDCAIEQMQEPTFCNKPDDKCFVLVDGVFTQRGCVSELEEEPLCTKPYCQICEGDGCNSALLEKQYCFQCDGNDDGCGPELDEDLVEPEECQTYELEGVDGCFTLKNETKRGCVDHSQLWSCDETDECVTCSGKACNKDKSTAMNTAHERSAMSLWLLSFVTLVALRL